MTRLAALLLIAALPAVAQSVTSDPIGFNKVSCLSNSDTIVGVPLRKEGSQSTKLAADPVVAGDSATLAVTATLGAGQFTKHYAKFVGGAKDGHWYDITANDTNSITIGLNGDTLTGAVAADPLVIAEHWTLGTLFDPAIATTDPTTTGHAIVASLGTLAFQRRTEILLPDLAGTGVNRAAASKYYIVSGEWRLSGDPTNANKNELILNPDSYFIIRHPATVTANTTFRSLGEVETKNWTIALASLTTGQQDTYISLLRPVPVTLSELNLWQSGAFVASAGTLAFQRRDVLLVFDNATAAQNKSASATYYHNGTNWLKVNDGTTVHDSTVIPAGFGFIVRKYMTATGATSFWKNIPYY
jgi:uncharacterized protein (TIGR02597 family)